MNIKHKAAGIVAVFAASMAICTGIAPAAAQGGKPGVERLYIVNCGGMSPQFYE